jgi:1-acyl-sn-glycerol-3-phosphate acyltransferase
MPRILLIIMQVAGYAAYFLSSFAFCAGIPVLSGLYRFKPRARDRLIKNLFHGYCEFLTQRLLPAFGIYTINELSGMDGLPKKDAFVVVANHRCRIDGPMLLGIFRNTAAVIKEDYARLPIFAPMVRHLDFVSIDQNSIESLSAAMEKSRRLLDAGRCLLIFPEGARAPGGRLLLFKDMAFRLSMEMNVPVVPVVLHTDLPFMAKRPGSIFPKRRMRFVIRVLKPLQSAANERPQDFAGRVRELLARQLKELDKGTAWEV